MRKNPRRYRLICGLMLAVLLFGMTAIAAGESASVTVKYPLSGTEFQIYRAAKYSRSGDLILTGDLKNAKVTLDQPDQAAADTLALYAQRHELDALDSGKTGRKGTLTFSELTPGLYLIVGQRTVEDDTVYEPVPFLVLLAEGDAITAEPKYDKTSVPDDGDTVDRKVLKIWEDDGYEAQRPKRIRVELLRDGEVWDTVTLNEKNNWRYTWRDLDSGHSWKVVEQTVPEGYTVSVSREGITFVITNTYEEEQQVTPKPTPTPAVAPTPTPTSTPTPMPTLTPAPTHTPTPMPTPSLTPDQPDSPGPDDWSGGDGGQDVSDTPQTSETIDSGRTENTAESEQAGLPQTGTLSWPVPVLACGGMLLFLAGWICSRREDSDENW